MWYQLSPSKPYRAVRNNQVAISIFWLQLKVYHFHPPWPAIRQGGNEVEWSRLQYLSHMVILEVWPWALSGTRRIEDLTILWAVLRRCFTAVKLQPATWFNEVCQRTVQLKFKSCNLLTFWDPWNILKFLNFSNFWQLNSLIVDVSCYFS